MSLNQLSNILVFDDFRQRYTIANAAESTPFDLKNHLTYGGQMWAQNSLGVFTGTINLNNTTQGNCYAETASGFYFANTYLPSTTYDVLTGLHIFTAVAAQLGPLAHAVAGIENYIRINATETSSTQCENKLLSRLNGGGESEIGTVVTGIPATASSNHILRLAIAANTATSYIDGANSVTGTDPNNLYVVNPGTPGIAIGVDSTDTTGYQLSSFAVTTNVTTAAKIEIFHRGGGVSGAATYINYIADGPITGSVIVTPSDNGAGGAFSPTTVTLSESTTRVGVVTYTPASTGQKVLTCTNNGSLTNGSVAFTSVSGSTVAYALMVSGAATSIDIDNSVTLTIFPVGGAITGTVALTSDSTGTFSATSLTFSASSTPQTVTYTPTAGGNTWHNITASMSGLTSGVFSLFNIETSITVSTPVPYQTVQRDRFGNGRLAITGTALGVGTQTPISIQASFNGGAAQVICNLVSSGSWSGTLNIPQGQGTLTISVPGRSDIVPVTVANVGCGEVFLCIGQSNMSGFLTTDQEWQTYYTGSLLATLFGNDYVWHELYDPYDDVTNQVDTVSEDSPPAQGSTMSILAGLLMTALGVPVCLIPCAMGGSTSTQWLSGANVLDRTTLLGSAIYRAEQVGGCRVALMWQGEADIGTTTPAAIPPATSSSNYVEFCDAINAALNVPVMPCTIPASASFVTAVWQAFNAVIEALWVSGNRSIIAGPDLSGMTYDSGEHFHTTQNGVTAANLWTSAIIAQIGAAQASGTTGSGSLQIGI